MSDDGQWSGHVDFGDLGIADRPPQAGGAPRADLAVAAWSLGYDYGGERRAEFFDVYGIEPDEERLDYYLRLWDGGE